MTNTNISTTTLSPDLYEGVQVTTPGLKKKAIVATCPHCHNIFFMKTTFFDERSPLTRLVDDLEYGCNCRLN
jgi:hypothetical protein